MGTDKHLKLRASLNSTLGQVITYIQDEPGNQRELASTTLQGRFLPFATDKDDPRFKEIAIRCANDCEAWAKAIREHAGLSTSVSPTQLNTVMGMDARSDDDIYPSEYVDNDEEEEEIDPELSAREKRLSEGGF